MTPEEVVKLIQAEIEKDHKRRVAEHSKCPKCGQDRIHVTNSRGEVGLECAACNSFQPVVYIRGF